MQPMATMGTAMLILLQLAITHAQSCVPCTSYTQCDGGWGYCNNCYDSNGGMTSCCGSSGGSSGCPGSDAPNTPTVQAGNSYSGTISSDHEDWAISASGGVTYTIEVVLGSLSDSTLTVKDSSGQTVACECSCLHPCGACRYMTYSQSDSGTSPYLSIPFCVSFFSRYLVFNSFCPECPNAGKFCFACSPFRYSSPQTMTTMAVGLHLTSSGQPRTPAPLPSKSMASE